METPPTTPPIPETRFVNEVRLDWKCWLAAVAILVVVFVGTPRVWKKAEAFEVGADYRIPYALSKDYWLYERRIEQATSPTNILLIGDSVIWGEYVLPDGTLSHFLNQQAGGGERFINAGVNGLYPLAMKGLLEHYAPLKGRKIIVHCNLLWMSSPKADLQDPKPQQINHSRLLPQFTGIPSYRADANERLSVLVERNVQFLSWVSHLQTAYFDNKSIPTWTLQADEAEPPGYPNSWKNPVCEISMRVPGAPAVDLERGPASSRHKAWSESGAAPTTFDWVPAGRSLQWQGFQGMLRNLRADGNEVFVIVGPFNTHIVAPENLAAFRALQGEVVEFLKVSGARFYVPDPLPSELYADASHPLTAGYELLARRMLGEPEVAAFLK